MRYKWGLSLIVLALPAWAGYEAGGVGLGASEKAVIKAFPSAHCQPLQWTSRAADRRCDDARISFGGAEARITFYLKDDKVQAFDVGFESRDAGQVAAFLKKSYGAPLAETRDTIQAKDKPKRDIYKVRWEKGAERAVMTAQMDRRRASLLVWRGSFDEEIYRVR
jgi:hypothetical protein